jgi:predicted SAM-dependent methyltransferase
LELHVKLYIGSRNLKPEGYSTIDLNPDHHPDILADTTDLSVIDSNSVDEVYASAILEHIAWPHGYKALSEWARILKPGGILKVSVPDMKVLGALISQGVNVSHSIGMIYGTGRLHIPLEAHQYGYTRETLAEMLHVLGFGNIDTWESEIPDASNGWLYLVNGEQIAVSLNFIATKSREPLVSTERLLPLLERDTLAPFMAVVRELASETELPVSDLDLAAITQQRLLFKLIEARGRIQYLEQQQRELQQHQQQQHADSAAGQNTQALEHDLAEAQKRIRYLEETDLRNAMNRVHQLEHDELPAARERIRFLEGQLSSPGWVRWLARKLRATRSSAI